MSSSCVFIAADLKGTKLVDNAKHEFFIRPNPHVPNFRANFLGKVEVGKTEEANRRDQSKFLICFPSFVFSFVLLS